MLVLLLLVGSTILLSPSSSTWAFVFTTPTHAHQAIRLGFRHVDDTELIRKRYKRQQHAHDKEPCYCLSASSSSSPLTSSKIEKKDQQGENQWSSIVVKTKAESAPPSPQLGFGMERICCVLDRTWEIEKNDNDSDQKKIELALAEAEKGQNENVTSFSSSRGQHQYMLLEEIARQLGLPVFSSELELYEFHKRQQQKQLNTVDAENHDDSNTSPQQSSFHYNYCLRMIPYTYGYVNDYALAIQALTFSYAFIGKSGSKLSKNNSISSKRPKQKKKQQQQQHQQLPFFIDLCPPPTKDRKTGKNNMRGSGNDLLLKALSLFKMQSSNHNDTGERRNDEIVENGNSTTKTATIVVWDLTAGLGRDATTIALAAAVGGSSARFGIQVLMVEQHPVVAALLQDALRRVSLLAAGAPQSTSESESSISSDNRTSGSTGGGSISSKSSILDHNEDHTRKQQQRQQQREQQEYSEVTNRAKVLQSALSLHVGEAVEYMLTWDAAATGKADNESQQRQQRPHVCYLDPMFPPRTKSAAVKKGMQLLQSLLGESHHNIDGDSDASKQRQRQDQLDDERKLLQVALDVATRRVVVKRPIKGPPLGYDTNSKSSDRGVDNKIPMPSYQVKGSVNRWDIYLTS